ncbi:MAG: phage portal protein [Alphaproteobacteria bacterium]
MIVERPLPGTGRRPRRTPRLDWLTRALGVLAPNLAARRIAGLMRLERITAVRAQFGYEASRPSRLSRFSGRGDTRTADQFNADAILSLRSQARELERNYDLAESVLTDLVGNVVGDGIRTFPAVKRRDGTIHREFNRQLARLWGEWAEAPEVTREHGWAGVQQMMARSWFRDGEVFAQLLPGMVRGLKHGSGVMLSLELLEADMVPYDLVDGKRRIVQGIEKDTWGRPVAYVTFKEHPGRLTTILPTAFTGAGPLTKAAADTKRIPASRMLHLKMVKRIRQTRGISVFAPVFGRLEDLKDYEHSERIAARIAAAFAVSIKRTAGLGAESGSLEIREMDIAPGIIFDTMGTDESVESIKNERPSNQLWEFRKSQLKAAAGGTGAKYSSMANDYDGTYSAQRQELVEHAVIYTMVRGQFIARAVRPVYRAFVEMAVAQGLVDMEGVDPQTLFDCDHRGQGAHYIDIQKEMNADEKAVQAGFKSRSQVILERTGRDPDDVFEEIAAERARDGEAGLSFSTSNGGGSAGDNPPEGENAEGNDEEADAAA